MMLTQVFFSTGIFDRSNIEQANKLKAHCSIKTCIYPAEGYKLSPM